MKMLKNPKMLLIVSMIVFGTIGLFVKFIPLSSGEIALYRAILATILLGLFLVITKQKINFKEIKKDIPLLVISGIAMGINWILLFEAYNYTTVSVATLSYYFAPVIVTIVSPILFKEKLTTKQIICFSASTIGLVMLTGIGDLSGGGDHLKGILFGVSAAVFYATVVLLNKYIQCNERSTFIPVLGNSFARNTVEIPVKHAERAVGDSKYSLWKLINLQFNLLTCMTTAPLRILTWFGLLAAGCGHWYDPANLL